MVGVDSVGWHVPRFRLAADEVTKAWGTFAARGIREKTVASYDEDETTMAVAAAEMAYHADIEKEKVGLVAFASSSAPAGGAKTVAEALGLTKARILDVLGSANAGLSAFMSCSEFVEATGSAALLVCGDMPRSPVDDPTDHPLGAAGVALFLLPGGGLSVRGARASVGEAMGERVDTKAGPRNYNVASRAAETIKLACRALNDGGYRFEEVDVAVTNEPDPQFTTRALSRLVDPKKLKGGVVSPLIGDTGATSPFLSLFAALDQAHLGAKFVVAAYGDGAATAMGLKWTDQLRSARGVIGTREPHEARGLGAGHPKVEQKGLKLDVVGSLERHRVPITYVQYLQLRKVLSTRDPAAEQPKGAYVNLPDYMATIGARYRLEGVSCSKCQHASWGPADICPNCGGHEFDVVAHPFTGKIYAATSIGRGAAPGEFAEQQTLTGEYGVAVVELDDGARLTVQLTDVEPGKLKIGAPVRSVFRRLYTQEGVTRYARKFAPTT